MSAAIMHGDCRELMAAMPAASVDSIVTDPPYEIGFMGKGWDAAGVAYDPTLWAEALRVLKPGGHLLAFGGTRTYHRMTAAIEDAGFEIRDSLHWLYGSGFPKSLDVSKAIDKQRYDRADIYKVTAWVRERRDAAELSNKDIDKAFGFVGMAGHWTSGKSQPAVPTLDQVPTLLAVLGLTLDDVPDEIRTLLWDLNGPKGQPGENWAKREVTGEHDNAAPAQAWKANYGIAADLTPKERRDIPATDAARQWEGWGTALKPAHEPIVVARKPLVGTVAANVLEHGTGALNIDGCQVLASDRFGGGARGSSGFASGYDGDGWTPGHVRCRWPANLLIDDVIAGRHPEWGHYFYVAKPSRRERNAGLDGLPERNSVDLSSWVRECGTCGCRFTDPTTGKPKCEHDDVKFTPPSPTKNIHPTVKPVALMRWLVRLVTPPGGTVLDPFTGSGTTGVAATLEGFDFIGCEMTDEYLPIIEGRLAWAQAQTVQPDLFRGDAT